MKAFQTFLNEVFDQPYEIKLARHSDEDVYFTFNTSEGKKGLIMFDKKMKTPLKPEYWQLDFSIDTQYGVTGGGEAFTIFSTVMSAIKEFLKLVDAKMVKFSAAKTKGDSRSSLYSTLVKKLARTYGYDFEVKDFASGSNYTLTKAS